MSAPEGGSRQRDAEGGGRDAPDLAALVYENLRRLARRYLRGEPDADTLEPTGLVHEAYLRLAALDRIEWQGKTHFFAMAATQMRRILVEHARRESARKRGAGWTRITLAEGVAATPAAVIDVLALDQALERLRERHERQGRVAEMRIFAGMSIAEIAEVLRVSERTVKQDWKVARAWLARDLRLGPPSRAP